MLLSVEGVTGTMWCAVATLVIGATTTSCTQTGQPGSDTSGKLAVRMLAYKSHGFTSTRNQTCTEPTGSKYHPPSTVEPKDSANYSAYAANVCFAYADQNGNNFEWSDTKNRSPGNIPMWIMPEARMRDTDPTKDAKSGMGMVVALVRNNDPSFAYADSAWKGKKVRSQQDALIWLSQDQKTAVLFTYDENGIVVLAKGSWTKMNVNPSNPNPRDHPEALWNHPPEQGQTVRAEGTGWVTCLEGCCTPNGIVESQ